MKKKSRFLVGAASTAALLLGTLSLEAMTTNTAVAKEGANKGKEIAFSRKKGNCLACHVIEGGESPGIIGPPLVSMKARFPDRAVLKEQISDPTIRNPISTMPPFGKHKILSDKELELVVDFIWTL